MFAYDSPNVFLLQEASFETSDAAQFDNSAGGRFDGQRSIFHTM